MGVQPPEVEAFKEEPRTPPGLRGDSTEDDLFSDTGTTTTTNTTSVFNFDHITFRNIFPDLPAKGVFEDFLGVDHWDAPSKKDKYCGKCFEDVKKDLKKLAEAVDSFKNERDVARKESEILKKEIEELKKRLKEKEEIAKGDVKVKINNGNDNVDVLVRNIDSGNYTDSSNYKNPGKLKKFGILTFSISISKDKSPYNALPPAFAEVEPRKTVADLRREFFAKEFESEQKSFTSKTFLEIKPEEKQETFRSKLNIRVRPKKKITELISKLTSRIAAPKVIPDSAPIEMFQRFEKTRTVWVNQFEEMSI